MTDKERLEEIKNSYLEGLHRFFGTPWVSMPKENSDWLIQQAERAQKNAQDLEDMDRQLYSEQQQNKRYKQALEEILNADCNLEGLDAERELDRVTDIALKALEVEE
jgi:uncharacterized tellurite resistance protein B-like protein